MGKFDFLFSKFKKDENIIDSTIEEIEPEAEASSILMEAEKAAAIIDEGIENGDFSGMCEQLEELSSSQLQRERYVFERPRSDIYIAMIVIFCIFQNTPDVLIGAVFTALFGELGFCTLIYKTKYGKKRGDDEE